MKEPEKFPYVVLLVRPGKVSHVRVFWGQAAEDEEAVAMALSAFPNYRVDAVRSYFQAQPRVLMRIGEDDRKSPPEPLYMTDMSGAVPRMQADCYLTTQIDDRYIPSSNGLSLEFL